MGVGRTDDERSGPGDSESLLGPERDIWPRRYEESLSIWHSESDEGPGSGDGDDDDGASGTDSPEFPIDPVYPHDSY